MGGNIIFIFPSMFSVLKKCAFVAAIFSLSGHSFAGLSMDASGPCADGAMIASIELNGLEHTQPHVVLRELINKVGKPYSQKDFESEKLRLQDLDLFTEIYVTCEPTKESINEMLAVPSESEPEPSSSNSGESSRTPDPDELSSLVTSLSSNNDSLSSFISRLSSDADTLSSLVSRLTSNTDSVSSLVSRLASNTDSLSSIVSRITSSTGALSSLIPPPVTKPDYRSPSTSNYFPSIQSLNTYKLTYHFKEIFRWIPSPDSKTTDRDGLMLGLALANLNILGEDIRAEVHYRTAIDPIFEKNEYAIYASSPYLFGIPLGWNIDFTRTDSWDDIREFRDASWLLGLDVNWKLLPHYSILGKAVYRYLEKGPGILPEFGLGVAVDYRDSEQDSRMGFYFESAVTHVGAGGSRGESYVEFLEDARAYYTFGRFITGASALVRLRPGDVKRYDYFYHGGTNSFRGLKKPDAQHLGVHEMLLTLEERFVLLERRSASLWGVNFFYGVQLVAGLDGSVLWDKGAPGWKNYEGAVYGGLHIVVPALDRIRFEIGYSPDKGEPKFTWGITGKTTTQRWRNR